MLKARSRKISISTVNFDRAKHLLEANDGAGNTFKATAKPVLIGTAVVGATTMIFSIIMALTNGLTDAEGVAKLSLLYAPFFLGLITGGAMIYWFTGASTQAVTTGAYRAVEFIKANIKLEGVEKASVADSKKVVAICTQYAQKGMLNIFIAVFFGTLAFAFVDPFYFVGYLISIAIFGLYQAIFMANAGAAWDNAKKIVEVEMKQKGTPLHDATVIGDTVGDPFKDTSSVALNPVIKFTTLFGLLAVELAVKLASEQGTTLTRVLALAFFVVSFLFVYRSFYGMRIKQGAERRDHVKNPRHPVCRMAFCCCAFKNRCRSLSPLRGWTHLWFDTHGLRCGLYSFAALRLPRLHISNRRSAEFVDFICRISNRLESRSR